MLPVLGTMVRELADGGEEFGFVVRVARGEKAGVTGGEDRRCCRWMGGHLEGSGDVGSYGSQWAKNGGGGTREKAGPEEMSRPLSLSAGLCPAGKARGLRKILPSGSAGREESAIPSSLPALSERIP